MTKLDFAFLLAASVSSGSVAFDREAVVTQFEQPLGVESAKQHDEGFVPNVMGSHFRALQNEPDMPTIQSRLHVSRLLARDSYWTQLDRININSMHSTLCSSRTYVPSWWLPASVELRRAANFELVAKIACENRIPVYLLDAVVAHESGYKGWAMSPAGAMGMMQIMPGTAKSLGLVNPWDSIANIRAGARYLRQQLDRFGRVDLALAAYNAGPERRSLAMGYIPSIPETRNYVRIITTNWLRLTQLNRPDSMPVARAAAASTAVMASGYREVSLVTYDGTNAANPI
jgi:hypothetical protein